MIHAIKLYQMSKKKSTDGTQVTDWRKKFPTLEGVSQYLTSSYTDLQNFRTTYNTLQNAHDNAYDISIMDENKDPDLIRSSVIKEGVDIFSGGMLFPEWNVDPIVMNGPDSITLASLASAVLDWMIIESGFEEAYDDGKEPMSLHGDSYRRPFKRKIGDGVFYPQYEEFDGTKVLLDTESTELWSKTVGKTSAWSAYIDIYSRSQIIVRFGPEILPYLEEGAHIDSDGYSAKTKNKDTSKDEKFYELIELQDISEPFELVLVGKNWLPLGKAGILEQKEEKIPADVKKAGGVWKEKYQHVDEFDFPMLTMHNAAFYVDRRWIRNKGLGHRLFRFQKADEALQNTALNASRMRGIQIPVMLGVTSNVAQDRFEEWKERRAEDVFAFLDVSASTPDIIPKVEILKFDGVRAEEMRASMQDLYAAYRNYVGIDFTRLEVRNAEGLGQSKLIEAEKVKTVEDIVKKQMGKLQHELKGLLLFFINNKGFGLKDVELEYTQVHEDIKSVTGEPIGDVENPHATTNLVEAAKRLDKFAFKISVNMDTIVDRNQLAILEDLTRITGLVDGAAMPEEKKALLQQIFRIANIRIPTENFEGVVNEVAQGGAGQFQGGIGGPQGPQIPTTPPIIPTT